MRIVERTAREWAGGVVWILGLVLALAAAMPAPGQTPELDALKNVAGAVGEPAAAAAEPGASEAGAEEPKGKLDEIVAESSGPISVTETVNDAHMLKKLEELLPKYPGVRRVDV